jgi:hypothetical protein
MLPHLLLLPLLHLHYDLFHLVDPAPDNRLLAADSLDPVAYPSDLAGDPLPQLLHLLAHHQRLLLHLVQLGHQDLIQLLQGEQPPTPAFVNVRMVSGLGLR